MNVAYKVGDEVSVWMPRGAFDIWIERLRTFNWNVPLAEKQTFVCTDTAPGSLWPMKTFWDRDLGHFNSSKPDLSDLGEPYLSVAKTEEKRRSSANGV